MANFVCKANAFALEKLLKISPAQIDRLLKPDRAALQVRGISGTKSGPPLCGTASLMKQIPIRTHYAAYMPTILSEHFAYGELSPRVSFKRTPSAFANVLKAHWRCRHHCGDTDSDEFNLTLTVTDVASGWTELIALKNNRHACRAHKWTLEGLQATYKSLPFKMRELHSDNAPYMAAASSSITTLLIGGTSPKRWPSPEAAPITATTMRHIWRLCRTEKQRRHRHICRVCRFVRNYVGYYRYDTDKELAALAEVYRHLCPLVNFFIPNKKLISKTTVGSKTVKKYDSPKTAYLRLLEATTTQQEKDKLTATRSLYNPVELQQSVHRAVYATLLRNALLAAHKAKVTFSNAMKLR